MNLDDLSPLEKLAVHCAFIPPKVQGSASVNAQIPWDEIDDLRAECERLGIDWRALHDRYAEIMGTRANRTQAARMQAQRELNRANV